jgi:hypothetical protein
MMTACNQVYSLGETFGPDSDGDGASDDDDNCVLVVNTDQRDGDGDGVGDACDPCVAGPQLGVDGDRDGVDDACDPCLTGSNLDEDGDTHLDGCDVCPGSVDDQVDGDGDGVGDACDLAPGVADQRVLFDGFAPPRPTWNTGFADWTVNDAGFGPAYSINGNFIGAWNPEAPVRHTTDWWIETAIHIPPAALTDGTYFNVIAVTESGGSNGTDCGLFYSAGRWTVMGTTTPVALGEEMQLRLRVLPAGGHECVIDDKVVRTSTVRQDVDSWFVLLTANTHVEFRWVDIVD